MDGRIMIECRPVRFTSIKAVMARIGDNWTGIEYQILRKTLLAMDRSSSSLPPLCASNRAELRRALTRADDFDPHRGDEIIVWLVPEPGDVLLFQTPV
jgi:hypothetical protein